MNRTPKTKAHIYASAFWARLDGPPLVVSHGPKTCLGLAASQSSLHLLTAVWSTQKKKDCCLVKEKEKDEMKKMILKCASYNSGIVFFLKKQTPYNSINRDRGQDRCRGRKGAVMT